VKWIAVTTVRDDGAAAVAKQALADAGIPVEILRLGNNPYFGSVTAVEWEVRVPHDRLDEAEEELERLEHQAEESLMAEAGVPPDEEEREEAEEEKRPDPALRPRKISWAIVISLLVPFPAGCLYARAFAIGYILIGMFVVAWCATYTGYKNAAALALFARGVDLVLAPIFVVQWNKEREKENGAQPG
jgi:hypothetical protein